MGTEPGSELACQARVLHTLALPAPIPRRPSPVVWGQMRSSSIWANHPTSLRCPLCLVWNPQGFVPSVSVASCTRLSLASLDTHLLRISHHSPPPTFPSQLPGCPRAPGPPNISVQTHFCQAHTLNPSASLKSESILLSHGLFLTLLHPLQWFVPWALGRGSEPQPTRIAPECSGPTGFLPALQLPQPPPDCTWGPLGWQ